MSFQNHNKFIADCPECFDEIVLRRQPKPKQMVQCPTCKVSIPAEELFEAQDLGREPDQNPRARRQSDFLDMPPKTRSAPPSYRETDDDEADDSRERRTKRKPKFKKPSRHSSRGNWDQDTDS